MNQLVLSLFPGIGLLDRAFEEHGFCIVRGPDLIWGGDIRHFHPPAGRFDGVIGGPPCQLFCNLARLNQAQGRKPKFGNLLPEFERCITEAGPAWFLMENVLDAPIPRVDGYIVKDFVLDSRWIGQKQSRRRRFSFGTPRGKSIEPYLELTLFENPIKEYAVIGGNGGTPSQRDKGIKSRIPIEKALDLQGLPVDFFKHSPFTADGKRQALANGVPIPLGRVIAKAVKEAIENVRC